MDVRFIESLMAVADLGSITAAARMQGLTSAAVSQRIQVLEQDVGVPLLLRRANTARPTQACLELMPVMRQMVELRQRLRATADPARAEGVLRLGAISTMLSGAVPGMLRTLRDIAPNLEVKVEPGTSARLYDAVRMGDLDAALVVAPPFAPAPTLSLFTLREEPLCLLAPEGLTDLTVEDVFRRLPLIAYDPNSWGGQRAELYLRDRGIAPERFCSLDGLEAISELVASGVGASIVPMWSGLRGGRRLHHSDTCVRRIVLVAPIAPRKPLVLRGLCRALGLPEGAAG